VGEAELSDDRPLCIDLFCGLGGWAEGFVAEGYRIVGFDIDPRFAEPYRKAGGEFVLADVRTLDGRRFKGARCIVASPPCQEFSTAYNAFNPEKRWRIRDGSLWAAAKRIAKEAGVPLILENVAGAQRFFGRSGGHYGPFHLWGDLPLIPVSRMKKGWSQKWSKNGRAGHNTARSHVAEVAKIPLPLARAVARGFL